MSKCQHIEGVPLQPAVAARLHTVYLSKGVHGTASIEGNTLSEEEVRERIEGDLALPKSREYLGREIDNIIEISNEIWQDAVATPDLPLSAERICEFNRKLLDGLPLKPEVVPGETRGHSVTVGISSYRGAPAEDCDYLLEKLADWLNAGLVAPPDRPELKFPIAVLKAIMAHLYLAWIHPFGDGNGRTARLIELQLMVQAGAPIPTAHLLSDHYNRTRDPYYIELDKTSRDPGYPVESFIQYALQGFVDELRDQIDDVREQQFEVTWQNYVHDMYRNEETPAKTRQRHLVLDMEPDKLYAKSEIPDVSTRVAREYAGKESKTVTRDLNELRHKKLVTRVGTKYRANRSVIAAFLPAVAKLDDE
ncbi:Fic family protein [Rhodococcus fascians]|nr:Fic family protein [Rhodococcus fascians]MBY4139636.1 Fic family protein [Rhodococcus fascians]MBY4216444.1 Fic family protein [Rhodococcus fascians]MBY4225218.1 Fic family protein [Rhodococcus fascians]MBY4230485.1 Fic family protein [Rhodococcus fascians]